mmetsp:Transcript_11103/g.11964  ORF Transcript_11103/g.11964 Transcript_11103/m.11964 type:complete len:123 (-) Transcript_11103:150-518(-)
MSANNETKNNEVEEDVKIEDEPEDQNNHLDNEKARAAKGVNSVTDFVQEKEATDVSKAVSALETLKDVVSNETVENITLKEEDVKLLVDECEITKEQAENLLRSQKGNLTEALRYYLQGNPI